MGKRVEGDKQTVATNVTIPENILEAIDGLAAAEGRSRSSMIVKLIRPLVTGKRKRRVRA